jgi:DNA-directed RNA polymerase subunit RPC12/RpoP
MRREADAPFCSDCTGTGHVIVGRSLVGCPACKGIGMKPRAMTSIRCIDCGSSNAFERVTDNVVDIHCPDCGSTFGWGNLPNSCPACRRRIYSRTERAQGRCSTCEVASWTAEKRAEIDGLIGRAFKGGG